MNKDLESCQKCQVLIREAAPAAFARLIELSKSSDPRIAKQATTYVNRHVQRLIRQTLAAIEAAEA
jgi:hypothetical protein